MLNNRSKRGSLGTEIRAARTSSPVQDSRFTDEFHQKLGRYMGDYDLSSAMASMYVRWYEDHAGKRSDWFRTDLIWRLELRRALTDLRVLDFGCGTGSSSVVFAESGARVVGAETEEVSLEVAAQRARDLGVQRSCSFVLIPYLDGQNLSLPFRDESFDLCTLIGVLEHMKPREQTVCAAELSRVLRPGGDLFIFDTPNRAYPRDSHTTQLWFIGWMPEFIAREYSILRRRFDRNQDFRRYGGNGVSRNRIDELFPPKSWRLSYEKSTDDVAADFGSFSLTACQLLRLVKLIGCRPAYWTANHALCFTKLPEDAGRA